MCIHYYNIISKSSPKLRLKVCLQQKTPAKPKVIFCGKTHIYKSIASDLSCHLILNIKTRGCQIGK